MAVTDPVVVIGAGVGGLSAAIHLAAAGRRVVVFEQHAEPGGKMGEVRCGGYRWDTGPSVITMRPVLEELFATAGRRLEDELTLLPVEPLTRYFWRDGETLDASADPERMANEVARVAPGDVAGYLRFLRYAARLHNLTRAPFIAGPPPSAASLLAHNPFDGLRIDPFRTLNQAVSRHVRSPHLRMLLNRFATYVGASPYLAPATLAVIAHVELADGVWYPRGGIRRIADALVRGAVALGVDVRANCRVQAIDVRHGRAAGVVDASGAYQPAAAVVSNVDVATTYAALLPPGEAVTRRLHKLARREFSCSGFVLLLGIEGRTPQLAHHNIFFPTDTRAEFDDIFRHGRPPHDPTLYVCVSSRTDPEHAPPGHENWFVLVNAPPAGPRLNWDDAAPAYAERVLERLAAAGLETAGRVRAQVVLSPAHLERNTGAWRGALYGFSSNRALNAFRRPHNRCPDVRGLYFAGGTTHPGGGVPMVALSGRLAAKLILEDGA